MTCAPVTVLYKKMTISGGRGLTSEEDGGLTCEHPPAEDSFYRQRR